MPYRFESFPGGVVVTNDFGGCLVLSEGEFTGMKAGRAGLDKKLLARLSERGFVKERLDFEGIARVLRGLQKHSFSGPGLHILVVTSRCNHSCVYCRVEKAPSSGKGLMTLATAKKCVDMAFCTPNGDLGFEFQGGEPLLNWAVVRDTVIYARGKNRKAGKNLDISVVTNLSLMDEEKFSFLSRHGVGICSSLDGPAFLHDANRRWGKNSSHEKTVYWLKRAVAASGLKGLKKARLPSPFALMTATRLSLAHPREIVETYRALGLGGIFLRPLSPIGHARTVWGDIGYTPEEFTAFYRAALARVIEVNRRGERFIERNAAILARKAIRKEDPNYVDLRSPCGAAVGQLAYNWDGGVYTCDEGRMAGLGQDDFFLLGNVHENSYREIIGAPAARACVMASCLENQPACSRCAWKPFCGVCPVYNYETHGSPWGGIAGGDWCKIQKGIFSAVFETLTDPVGRGIIEGWFGAGGGAGLPDTAE